MRRISIWLGILLVGSLMLSCQKSSWTQLTSEQAKEWVTRTRQFPHYPAAEIPADDGVWVDNGCGDWNYISLYAALIPFCAQQFRVAIVSGNPLWWDDGGLYDCYSSDIQNVVGTIRKDVVLTRGRTAIYVVTINRRVPKGLYSLNPGISKGPWFFYADPRLSTAAFPHMKDVLEEPVIVVRDGQTDEEIDRFSLLGQGGEHFYGKVKVPGRAAAIEFSFGRNFPPYDHWMRLIGTAPTVHRLHMLVHEVYDPTYQGFVTVETPMDEHVRPSDVLVQPEWDKSTNFQVRFRCELKSVEKGNTFRFEFTPGQMVELVFWSGEH